MIVRKGRSTALSFTTCAAFLLSCAWFANAGDLNPPPGPIAPTHKTLTEVEPRIAINATNTPGDADSVFRITQPGSYYLAGNLAVAVGKSGIEIAANNVTVDLQGQNLQGIIAAIKGVSVDAPRNNITIRNGTLTGFTQGGINLRVAGSGGSGAVIENVQASGNPGGGISVGDTTAIRDCTAFNNGGAGFVVAKGSTISNCSASKNTGAGFSTTEACTLTNCSAEQNAGFGFILGNGCTVTGCSAYRNDENGLSAAAGSTITNCSAYLNQFNGIAVGSGCTVVGCAATFNALNGILCVNGCTVRGNNCHRNGDNGGDGAGIYATSIDNRIEGNICTGADRGIDVDAPGNIIIRNSCAGNTTNWDVVAGNVCFVVQGVTGAAIVGNSGGMAPGSTDPNANFTY